MRFTDLGGVGFDGPPLAFATKVLREKKASGSGAKEEQLRRLEAVRRLLLRVEAARAVSWVWPGGAPDLGHDSSGTRRNMSTSTSTPTSTWTSTKDAAGGDGASLEAKAPPSRCALGGSVQVRDGMMCTTGDL